MLQNFLRDIAGLACNFTMVNREKECFDFIQNTVGNNKVLVSPVDYANAIKYLKPMNVYC